MSKKKKPKQDPKDKDGELKIHLDEREWESVKEQKKADKKLS